MKPLTKTLVVGGVATAVLGPALVASVMVSVGSGAGTFVGITVEDGVPAFTDGIRGYEGGQSEGIFGETAPAPAPEPVAPAPQG